MEESQCWAWGNSAPTRCCRDAPLKLDISSLCAVMERLQVLQMRIFGSWREAWFKSFHWFADDLVITPSCSQCLYIALGWRRVAMLGTARALWAGWEWRHSQDLATERARNVTVSAVCNSCWVVWSVCRFFWVILFLDAFWCMDEVPDIPAQEELFLLWCPWETITPNDVQQHPARRPWCHMDIPPMCIGRGEDPKQSPSPVAAHAQA